MKKLLTYTVIFVCFLAFTCMAHSEYAMAKAYFSPNWIKIQVYGPTVVRNKKIKDKYHAHAYLLQMKVKYTNNSNDKVVRKIYKKFFSGKLVWNHNRYVLSVNWPFNKVNNCEIYPGHSYTLTYTAPIMDLKKTFSMTETFPFLEEKKVLNKKPFSFTLSNPKGRHGFNVSAEEL